jgi:hypothetical protein
LGPARGLPKPPQMRTTQEPLEFRPSTRVLAAALDELADAGSAGGGAVDETTRRRALAAYLAAGSETPPLPAGWRHPYASLPFADLAWSTGRMRVPALPKMLPRSTSDADVPALALDAAAGLVHLGSIYLEPARADGDPRVGE